MSEPINLEAFADKIRFLQISFEPRWRTARNLMHAAVMALVNVLLDAWLQPWRDPPGITAAWETFDQ